MNRKRIEQELSLHLDGRLPSARREALLAHLENDDEAARLWEEMQAAQEMALELPGHEVGSSFHDSLWKRIRSGEGTPEAVFRDPVPLRTRVRYVATGAAAAAAVIACLHLLFPGDSAPAETAGEQAIAAVPDDVAPQRRAPEQGLWFAGAPSVEPLNPLIVARASQEGAIESVHQLRSRLPEIEERLEVVEARELVPELDPFLERFRGSADLMRWMDEERIIELPASLLASLELASRTVDRFAMANSNNDSKLLRIAVQDFKALDPSRLRADFDVKCCKDPTEFVLRFREHVFRNREAARVLRLQVVPDGFGPALMPLMPGGWPVTPWSRTDNQSLDLWVIESPGGMHSGEGVQIHFERRSVLRERPAPEPGTLQKRSR